MRRFRVTTRVVQIQELKVSNVLNPSQESNEVVKVGLDISSQQVSSSCTSASSSGTNYSEEFSKDFDEFDSILAQMDEDQMEEIFSGISTGQSL